MEFNWVLNPIPNFAQFFCLDLQDNFLEIISSKINYDS